ncbi:MAG: cell division protein FtsQ/DivIB [Liquorilactobacillus nagelii]|uniref:Cell division protein DivIB n=1 Tax=Liquorilactobacillus nagelii TaxID=82688 RepID=A0A3Q8CGU1_9LACO|nr:cell division protein FtsQ/DivIB [Liquorilactobacillus nagelii]AUJ32344.1 hypothetical protein BSQ50_07090 [Liquorilactobacillus nagelii]MCC7615526.1 hypothetical protein [Liquorilactobacillus nagelii]MCP9314602.1 cell division protein FtsQ/DivIB [Liquorilactobacillus nagelii]
MAGKKKNKQIIKTSVPLTPWEKAQIERKQQNSRKRFDFLHKKRIGNKLPELVALHHKRLKRALILNLLGFTILLLGSLYFISPYSKITEVDVLGLSPKLEKQVIKFSGLKSGDYVVGAFLKQKKLEKQLRKKMPEVKQVNFSITGRNVQFKLIFNRNLGYVEKNNQFYRLGLNGKISHLAHSSPQGNTPLYVGFADQNLLKTTVQQVQLLSPKIVRAISEIHAEPTKTDQQKLHLYMNDGNQVLATTTSFARKMKYYPEIKAQTSGKVMIDLQVGAFSYQLN